ncbi:MAG: capsule assembly Wzi family protein [Cyclobacteriaceae bacterium]|nr:capsule assembly Wzi family protein [Cyclobacteriaceae bacterium]
MTKKAFLILILCVIYANASTAQSTNIPLNKDTYHLIDRLEILSGDMAPNHHSAVKPYTRKAIGQFTDSIQQQNLTRSRQDKFNLEYLRNDNWEWVDSSTNVSKRPFLKHFYKNKSDFYYGADKEEAIGVHISPVLYLSYGGESAQSEYTYINTRGVQVRGLIDKKVGFYAFISENQARFPVYVQNFVAENRVIPGEGFWKPFGENGYDFFNATGYISVNATKHINFQFGHDRQFIGDGYRSMLMSDFSPPSLFLKINTQVWKINYTNLFTQVFADAFGNSGGSIGNTQFPRKYLVAHRLGINIGKNINLGVFESIVFGREDSLGNNPFELGYLNPIIFYRALEQQNGSLDNALVGLDAKWNFLQHFSMYGQFILDEFKISELKAGNGWWANKFGYQIGLKYIDALGLKNLDLQVEYNSARPYTYTHSTIYSSYTNYNQAIAHPLGANFEEMIGILRYQPIPRLSLTGKLIYAKYGLDAPNENWGKDILKDYNTREQEYGNFIGQGIASSLLFMDFTATYQLKHNVFFDAKLIAREQKSDDPTLANKSTIYSFAFRWNIAQRLQEF